MAKWHTFAGGTACSGTRANGGPWSYSVAAHAGGEFKVSPTCPRGRHTGYAVKFVTVDQANRAQHGKLHSGLWHDVGHVRSPAQAATMIKKFCATNDLRGARRR